MRNEILVYLSGGVEFQLHADEAAALSPDDARAWLDAQFVALGCEPLRPSGKVLTVDKVLRVTEAAGARLLGTQDWAAHYARAVHGALGKPMIRVDVPAMAITF